MKDVLPKLISKEHGAFVATKLIHEQTFLAQEIVNSLNHHHGTSILLKLDMSKAYDRVNWQFLEDVMRALCFSCLWIHKVMLCVSTISHVVVLNGGEGKFFKSGRG